MTMTVKPSNGFGREVINNAVVFGSIFVFAFVAFSLFYPITSSYADDMDVHVLVEPTLSMSLSADEINLDIDASNYGNVVESDPLTVNVSTNNRTGYNLILNGSNVQAPSETRTLADISTMQAITEDICRNTPLYSASNATYELTDTRDNNVYSIRRLDDGNCWMVENLKLPGGTTITPEDSDVTVNFTLPESSLENMTSSNANTPLMYDGLDNDGDGVTDDTYDSYGAYYNWYTATANSGAYNVPGNAPSSICAKGWKLPNHNNYNELLGDGNVLDSSEIDAVKVVTAGFYYASYSGASYTTNYGAYNTPDQKNFIHHYYRDGNGSIYHDSTNWTGLSISVRCIATTGDPITYSDLKPTSSQNTATIDTILSGITRSSWQSSSDYNNRYGFTHDNTDLLASDNFIPVYTDTNPTTIKNTDSASKNSNTNISFAAKVDSSQQPGNYSNDITISAVANYASSGATIFSIHTMQQMTPEICKDTTTPLKSATDLDTDGSHRGDPNYVPQTILRDTRGDGQGHEQTYVVRKLADGNCWMAQNLNLALSTSTPLTSDNSDIHYDSITNIDGYTATLGNPRTSWTPDATTQMDDPNVEGYQNVPGSVNNSSTSYYRGDEYCYGVEQNVSQTCTSDLSTVPEGMEVSQTNHVGILYNWYAATAGTGTSNLYSHSNQNPINAPDSICPKGWQLPTGGESDAVNANGNRYSFYNLLEYIYNSSSSVIPYRITVLRSVPYSYISANRFSYNRINHESGAYGYLWSSSASSGSQAFYLIIGDSGFSPRDDSDKYNGSSIRCVAR